MNKFCVIKSAITVNIFRSNLRYAGTICCNIERHYMTTPTTLISAEEYSNGVAVYLNELIVLAIVCIVFVRL